jgi:hypothetical protein
VSGIMGEPPLKGGVYALLLPQVDADGNDVDGLRNTNMQAPLGTYAGWNIRKAGFSEGDSCDLTGAFIPFFETKSQRLAAGWSSGFAAVELNASAGTKVPPALISLSAATATSDSTDVGM